MCMKMEFKTGMYFLHALFTSWLAYTAYYKKYNETKVNLESEPTFRPMVDGSVSPSSVWCVGTDKSSRICTFYNLCVSSNRNEFIFFYSSDSSVIGIPQSDHPQDVLVELTSVANHDAHGFWYTTVPLDIIDDFNVTALNETVLIFARFNPENIMHVFHDDLLPLFATLATSAADTTRLFFMDGRPLGQYHFLYSMFFESNPISFGDLPVNRVTCFKKAHVGVSKHTTWYHYGFQQPQGPKGKASVLQASEIQKFAAFVRRKTNTSTCLPTDNTAILVSRKENRLILNEDEVVNATKEVTGARVLTVSLEDNTFAELVKYFSCSKLVVGTHGSLLIMSIFLPQGSALVEIFPYAINPMHYTAYKTLVEMPGMNLAYRAWANREIKHTVTHPRNPPELGGIEHLSKEEQVTIESSKEVPLHLCCYHPEWLYRIYQDTIVDVTSLRSTLAEALAEKAILTKDSLVSSVMKPAVIRKVRCWQNDSLAMEWKPPWNLGYMRPEDVWYEVWVKDAATDQIRAFKLRGTFLRLTLDCPGRDYYVWVRCLADNRNGSFDSYPTICNC